MGRADEQPKRGGQSVFGTGRSIRPQLIALFVVVTLVATLATGWLIYNTAADQLIDDAWQQSRALLETARTAVNRQVEQMRSFSWQLSNHGRILPLLYSREQTPESILVKRDLIDILQSMKAFSDTLSDIGLYLPMSDQVLTAESSYLAEDYFARMSPGALERLQQVRAEAAGTALSDYVGLYTIERLINRDRVLLFVSDLPVGQRSALGYAFFHVKVERLSALLPTSDSGAILLADAGGAPLLSNAADDALYRGICAQAGGRAANTLRYEGRDYSVLQAGTDVKGLYCTAVIPYSDILARADAMRETAMLVMCACLALCLLVSLWATRRLYAPIAGLMDNLEQLGHALPERGERNEFALLGDALHMMSQQNQELRLSNRQIHRLLKNRLLGDLMEGRLQGGAQASLREAGVALSYAFAQVAVIELDARGLRRVAEGLGADPADWVEQQRSRGEYGPLEAWCAQREDGKLLVLFNIDAGHPHPEALYDLLAQCRRVFGAYAPCRVAVGRAYRLGEASSSLVDAMVALRCDAPVGSDGILPAEEVALPPEAEYTLAVEQRLMNYTMSLQRDEVDHLLDELCRGEDADGDESARPAPVLRGSLAQALLFTARRAARQAGVEPLCLQSIEQQGLHADDLPQDERTEERIRRVFGAVMDAVSGSRGTQDERLYRRLTEYIQTQYATDISLDTASEALGLSPSYIGLIFRRVGDTSFARAVTEARVARARALLVETDLTVSEVGRQVGVENQNTFIRMFKKAEGVTPGQYRVARTTMDSQN